MLDRIASKMTPQKKAIGVNDRFGNLGIKKQQGTTRSIYDSLSIAVSVTEFRFFNEVSTRNFPLTNLTGRGNQLNVGETLVVERAYVTIFELEDGLVTSIEIPNPASNPDIAKGDLTIEIANTIVMKPIPMLGFFPEYNKSAYHDKLTVFEFNTQLVIPPMLEFEARLRTVPTTAIADQFLQLTLEGVGSIIAPMHTF